MGNLFDNGTTKSDFGDFYAIVHFENDEEPMHFLIEVKSKGERRYVNQFMHMASQYNNDADYYVFMAPYFSEESAQIMKNEGYSYMDLSGNCYILTKRIILHVSGQANKYLEKTRKEKIIYLKHPMPHLRL